MAKSNFKRCLCLGAVLLLGGCLSFGAAALTEEAPYYSYRYDHWGSPVETAQTYLPETVISGDSLGCGAMKLPTDLAVTSDNRVYILDSGNGRVLVLDDSLRLQDTLLPTDEAGEPLALSEPSSLFISEKFGQILIADKKAGVLVFDASLRLIRTLGCPDSPVLPDDFLFAPVSALVDSAGITYVISSNCYQGALQYDEHGRFLGFYGSEKVTLTLETMLNQFWKSILTEKQAANMKRSVPAEFVNFCVGDSDFIYTVRKGNDVQTAQVKKLNALGDNILPEKVFGDRGTTTQLADITVDPDGFITVLDSGSGRLFQYDGESNLLFAFGGKGSQVGLAQNPVAVQAMGNNLLLLDNQTGQITLFVPTAFASSVRNATLLCMDGKYQQAMEPWQAVLRQDSTYELANRGLGKAYQGLEEFGTAAAYYRKAYERELYSEAFRESRDALLQEHFGFFMLGIALLVLVPIAILLYRRKHKKSLYDQKVGRFHYPFYCLVHPFVGYTDLKERRKESFFAANVLLVLFVIVSILQRQVTGFAFNENRTDQFHLLFTLISTLGVFAAFVLCNWSITTILDGKGRLKEIWCYCAYALVPYILGTAVVILLSNLLTTDEAAFLTMAQWIVTVWTGLSLLMALKEVHMYTLGRTILTVLLTLAGLVIILIVCALCYTILSQLVDFIGNVVTELRMR